MAINRTGFVTTSTGVEIDKDTDAQLTYTIDWSEWLDTGDSIATTTWTVAARRNDPTPITIVDSGVAPGSTATYIEISGGQSLKTYTVHCTVATANGLIDRRNFRVNCVDRSA